MADDHSDDEEGVSYLRYRWDVFLSFRGADTRHGFTDRLYKALWLEGVRTFRDDEGMERGDKVKPSLQEAIQDSAATIAVISERYAESRWCLEELETALGGKKLLLPVFYGVDPSDVRWQRGQFGAGFRKLEKYGKEEELWRWREAMKKAANISGWDYKVWKEREQELIQELVERILKKLRNTPLGVAKYPVGLEARLEQLKGMIDANANEVLIIGFYGMGGVGKTTLAKALFNKLVGNFPRRGFVSSIREIYLQNSGGLESLQAKLIGDLSSREVAQIQDVNNGILRIKELTFEQPVLIVLDDVDNVAQLNALAGGRDWFYEGSRIIVTSRDIDVLPESIVNRFYEVKNLSPSDSIKLLSFHAIGREKPPRNLIRLAKQIVDLTGGLPLALEVFGSFLSDKRDVRDWQNALEKLKSIRPGDLQSVLEISFNALDREEKSMFLDIACFFIRMRMTREDAVYAFRACDFNAEITIKMLVAKCLLKVTEDEVLWMHDQIRDMGREIVHRENYDYPSMRSRLWNRDEILTVLKNKMGTEWIQGMSLGLEKKHNSSSITSTPKHQLTRERGLVSVVPNLKLKFKNVFSHGKERGGIERDLVTLHTTSFTPMVNMRLLEINHVDFEGSFKKMPSGIKWLQWKGCPLEDFPSSTFLQKLGVLDLSESSITKFSQWTQLNAFSKETAEKLLVMDLQACYQLTEVPDLSSCQVLEKLNLAGCKGLVEIHRSVGDMTSLVTLDMSGCSNLRKFPGDVSGLKNLQKLRLSDCHQLMELPDMGGMTSLKELHVDSTAIQGLPESIYHLQKLEEFSLKDCQSLKQLPWCIGELASLKDLALDNSSLEQLPDSIGSLARLESLSLVHCRSLTALPDTIGGLRSLRRLLLGNTSLTHLPASVGSLSRLKYLSLDHCRKLTELPESIGGLSSLVWLDLGSSSVEQVPSQIGALKMANNLQMAYCEALRSVPESLGNMLSLTNLNLDEVPITELPESIGMLERLHTLRLNSCRHLKKLPSSIGKLKSLVSLTMKETAIVALPDGFGMLSSLQTLTMRKQPNPENAMEEISEHSEIVLPRSFSSLCSLKELDAHAWGLSRVPDDLEKMTALEVLKLGYNKFHSLPLSLKGLKHLKELILTNCRELRSIPQLPSSLTKLDASNCTALESMGDLGDVEHLLELNLTNCFRVPDIPGLQAMESLRRLFLGGCKSCFPKVKKRLEKVALRHLYNLSIPASDIPSWFFPEITSFTPLKNRNIRGIIVAVVVSLPDENPNNIKSELPAIVDVKARVVRNDVEMHTTVLNLAGVPDVNEDQLYLIRFPEFKPIVKMLEEGDKIDIILRDPPYFPGIQLKKCGVCLVFENDDDYDRNEDWLDESKQSVSQKLARFIGSL